MNDSFVDIDTLTNHPNCVSLMDCIAINFLFSWCATQFNFFEAKIHNNICGLVRKRERITWRTPLHHEVESVSHNPRAWPADKSHQAPSCGLDIHRKYLKWKIHPWIPLHRFHKWYRAWNEEFIYLGHYNPGNSWHAYRISYRRTLLLWRLVDTQNRRIII